MPVVAMIGTRAFTSQSPEAQAAFQDAAILLARGHSIIRTGAAEGCDQEAANLALTMGGRVELVLPWLDFEQEWVSDVCQKYGDRVVVEVFDRTRDEAWLDSVFKYHPNPAVLSGAVLRLHARNYGLVAPVDFVVAMPQFGPLGGTAQGMRVACALGKAVYDVQIAGDRQILGKVLLGFARENQPRLRRWG